MNEDEALAHTSACHDGCMSHLISVDELSHCLTDVTVLDVRWALTVGRSLSEGPVGRADYEASHIPGAHFVDLDSELADDPGPHGRHPLPALERVQALAERCGITDATSVVVYDGRESFAAARAWWVLRWAGLTDVRVLDGGFAAWQDAGLPTSRSMPPEGGGDALLRVGCMPTLDAADVLAFAGSGLLLDARAPERYRGEVEPVDPVPGHIPGAVNSPTGAWLAPDGHFRDDLAHHWDSVVGAHSPHRPVAVYCGSGVTAAHHVLALAELGVPAALYPGSWSEWVADPARPVATVAD